MATHTIVRFANAHPAATQPEEQQEKARVRTPAYSRPELTFVGTLTGVVQGQPIGNRYDVYERWQD